MGNDGPRLTACETQGRPGEVGAVAKCETHDRGEVPPADQRKTLVNTNQQNEPGVDDGNHLAVATYCQYLLNRLCGAQNCMIKLSSPHLVPGVLIGLFAACTILTSATYFLNERETVATSLPGNVDQEMPLPAGIFLFHANDIQMEQLSAATRVLGITNADDKLFAPLRSLFTQANENSRPASKPTLFQPLLTAMVLVAPAALLPAGHSAKLCGRMPAGGYGERALGVIINYTVDGMMREEKQANYQITQAQQRNAGAFNLVHYWLLGILLMLLLVALCLIRHHIQRRKKIEQGLKRANDFYIKLFYESPLGLVITRPADGLILDCNEAFAKLVGSSRDEVLNHTTHELGMMPDNPPVEPAITSVSTVVKARNIETQLQPKGKDPVWVSGSIQPVISGNSPSLLCAMMDITSHRNAEQKMTKALEEEKGLNKMMSGFVTLASHEFRTPLSTILSSSFLIETYAAGEARETICRHASRINSSVKILTSILDEFLLLSRIEEGSLEPHPEELDIEALLQEVCLNLKVFCKPGQLITYSHTGTRLVYTDPLLLSNITSNLVSNSIKFSPGNTAIQVLSNANSKINLVVRDAGIGIPRSEQHLLFEKFYRASNAGTVQGTGIGLHLLKQYVQLLGGTIELESEPGRGSEFRITI